MNSSKPRKRVLISARKEKGKRQNTHERTVPVTELVPVSGPARVRTGPKPLDRAHGGPAYVKGLPERGPVPLEQPFLKSTADILRVMPRLVRGIQSYMHGSPG